MVGFYGAIVGFTPRMRTGSPGFGHRGLSICVTRTGKIQTLYCFVLLHAFESVPLVARPCTSSDLPFRIRRRGPSGLLGFLVSSLGDMRGRTTSRGA